MKAKQKYNEYKDSRMVAEKREKALGGQMTFEELEAGNGN